MNILIIYAHPNHSSLNYAIRNTVVSNISTQHSLNEIDLYQEHFSPCLVFNENHPRRDLFKAPETKKYRQLIQAADMLIFIFPIWWSGMPAILKGFIDRVFAKDFAYYYKGIRPIPMLKHKKAWIINTHDTPKLYADFFQKDYGKILNKQILRMCGIKTWKHTTMSYVRGSNEQQRKTFLKNIEKLSRRI